MIAYYTVVYRVDGDNTKHDEWWKSIHPLLFADNLPISIEYISKTDETTRLQCIEYLVGRGCDSFELQEVLDHPDPQTWWRQHVPEENPSP